MSNRTKKDNQQTLLLSGRQSLSLQKRTENEKNRTQSIHIQTVTAISKHIQTKINKFFLRYGGFRTSPKIITAFITSFLIVNLTVDAATINDSEYCFYLNICVLLFQVESMVLYGFAFWSISDNFIEKVVSQLVNIDVSSNAFKDIVQKHIIKHNQNDNNTDIDDISSINIVSSLKFSLNASNSQKQFQSKYESISSKIYNEYKQIQIGTNVLFYEAIKSILIMIPTYLSGFIVFFTNDNSSEIWHIYVYFSNGLDFIRYLPQFLHIALVRSYYKTFPIQLKRLRKQFGVIGRKDNLSIYDYDNFILTIKHKEFIIECEKVIRPYRRLSGKLSEWITIYFLCNVASFTFFLLSFLSAIFQGSCYKTTGIYYIHYLMELITFFVSWMFLVWPYCTNEYYLNKFFNDVKTMPNISTIEKCAIDRYIDSYNERSPFSIYSIKPSYRKFMNILYIVFVTIILDVVTKIENIDIL